MLKTIGNVVGGIGLLLVGTSLVTLAVTGSVPVFLVKVISGVVCVVVWAATNGERVSTWARSVFFYSTSIGIGAAFLAVLIAINFIVAKKAPTWDLTEKKIFSLSPQTESTLKDLKAPVKAVAYTEGPPVPSVERLFQRYAAGSDKFSWEFRDPNREPALVAKYQIRKGVPAAVLLMGDTHTVVNLQRLSNPQSAEQELTNGLIKLSTVGAQKLYFVSGHGEIPLEPVGQSEEAMMASLMGVKRILQDEGYAPADLNLAKTPEIPRDASAVVIAGARSRFTDPEKKLLALFLEEGGRLIFFGETQAETDLDALLAKYAVQIEPGIVADPKVNPEQPYVVITPFFGDHELTTVLKRAQGNVVFATTRALTVLREGMLPGVEATPLVLTTPYAWLETNLAEAPNLDSNEKSGQLALMVAVTRLIANLPTRRSEESRVLVFGDSDLLTGTFGYEPNRNLVLNSFAWATQQAKKITIRPPDRDISRVELSQQKLSTITLISLDFIPTLLMAVGLTIWRTRRAR